jgi:hypothetical protein
VGDRRTGGEHEAGDAGAEEQVPVAGAEQRVPLLQLVWTPSYAGVPAARVK